MKEFKTLGRIKRARKVAAKIKRAKDRPRLSVFRSNQSIYAQIIDDTAGKTLLSASEKELKITSDKKLTKTQKAFLLGELLAAKASKHKIKKVVLDRNGYKYHGRVKALTEGARKGGLNF